MERLTYIPPMGGHGIRGDIDDAVMRLAEIEDILGDDYNLSLIRALVEAERDGRIIVMKYAEREGVARMKELAKADKEGRCFVFPVKPGGVVRFAGNPRAKEETVAAVTIYADGRITYNFHEVGVKERFVDEWSEDKAENYVPVGSQEDAPKGEKDG